MIVSGAELDRQLVKPDANQNENGELRSSTNDHTYDVIVLGGGITGLTCAYELSKSGCRVCVIDEYDGPGGNHLSDNIDDMSFDIGAIFLWSDSPLFEMFPEMLDLCVPADWSIQRLTPQKSIRAYPIDVKADVLKSGFVRNMLSLAKGKLTSYNQKTAEDFINFYLGRKVSKLTGLTNYFERLYGKPPSEIDVAFARERMTFISNAARFRKVMKLMGNRKQPMRPFQQCLARPKAGFRSLYDIAVANLSASGVDFKFGRTFESIQAQPGNHEVALASETVRADRMINTIPINITAKLAGITDAPDLPSLKLVSLYWKFRGDLGFDSTILYNFMKEGRWKRLTVHSNYYGQSAGYHYFTTETTLPEDDALVQDCENDFRSNTSNLPILQGKLERVGARVTDFAYPVYDHDAIEARSQAIAKLSAHGIECIGRQGSYRYLPVAGAAIIEARNFLQSETTGAVK